MFWLYFIKNSHMLKNITNLYMYILILYYYIYQDFFKECYRSFSFLHTQWYKYIPSIVRYHWFSSLITICDGRLSKSWWFIIAPPSRVYSIHYKKHSNWTFLSIIGKRIWSRWYMYYQTCRCHWQDPGKLLHHQHCCLWSSFRCADILDWWKPKQFYERRSNSKKTI